MSPLVCTLPHTNCVFSTALLWCCLPLCFRGTPRTLECDFLKATAAAAAELNCLVLWSNQKRTHNSSGGRLFIWMETLSRGITRKETRAVAFGQGLRLAGWPGLRFHTEASCVTRTNTQRVSLAILCTPLFSTHSPCLWISGCYFTAYTRGRARRIQGEAERFSVIWGDTGEGKRERGNSGTF